MYLRTDNHCPLSRRKSIGNLVGPEDPRPTEIPQIQDLLVIALRPLEPSLVAC